MKALTVHMRSGPFLHEMGVKQQRGYPHLSWTTCRGVDNSASYNHNGRFVLSIELGHVSIGL